MEYLQNEILETTYRVLAYQDSKLKILWHIWHSLFAYITAEQHSLRNVGHVSPGKGTCKNILMEISRHWKYSDRTSRRRENSLHTTWDAKNGDEFLDTIQRSFITTWGRYICKTFFCSTNKIQLSESLEGAGILFSGPGWIKNHSRMILIEKFTIHKFHRTALFLLPNSRQLKMHSTQKQKE